MAAVLGGLVGVTAVAAAGAQFLPVLGVREGALRFVQIPLANGFIDYVTLLNERDGGINGVPLVWEECETVFDVARGVECYERLKAKGPTGAAAFQLASTPLVNALIERATHDQIPLLSHGRWARGRRGWAGVSVCLHPPDHLLESEHGQAPLHRPTGRRHGPAQGPENRPCLPRYGLWPGNPPHPRPQAAQYGFAVQHLAVQPPGLDQKATWLRVKVAQPDWVILRSRRRHDLDRPEGSGPGRLPPRQDRGGASDLRGAGDGAGRGGGHGLHLRDLVRHGDPLPAHPGDPHLRLCPGQGGGAGTRMSARRRWIRGMLRALLTTEALRTAMRHFGNQPLTGAQVQWGLEHLTLTAASLKELGAEGLLPPLTLSCRDHEGGGGVKFQQWDGHAVDGAHRLDRAGSGAGAAPGGGVGGQVCAGEGHHAAGLPVGACLLSQGAHGAFLRTRAAPNKALHLTAYSVRSCVAPASGSR